jgi:hypothetical protein
MTGSSFLRPADGRAHRLRRLNQSALFRARSNSMLRCAGSRAALPEVSRVVGSFSPKNYPLGGWHGLKRWSALGEVKEIREVVLNLVL